MAKRETAQQLLERVRGEREMSKDEFADALGITRQWYHKVLTEGRDLDLKTLAWLAVDYGGEWRGELANELIEMIHGKDYVPVGSREELRNFRDFLMASDTPEDMGVIGSQVRPGHFGLWAAELRDRLEKQLKAVKEENRMGVKA